MNDVNPENAPEHQDPAELKKLDTAVETEAQPEPGTVEVQEDPYGAVAKNVGALPVVDNRNGLADQS